MDLNFGVTSIVTLCIVISDGIIICFAVRNIRDRHTDLRRSEPIKN